jgi:hypothetical protein
METSVTLLTLGDTKGALAAAAGAQKIFKELLLLQPDSTDFQRELSVSYDKVFDVQVAQGNLPAALKSYQDGLAIADRLAKSDPGNAGWQRDLSVSYANLAKRNTQQKPARPSTRPRDYRQACRRSSRFRAMEAGPRVVRSANRGAGEVNTFSRSSREKVARSAGWGPRGAAPASGRPEGMKISIPRVSFPRTWLSDSHISHRAGGIRLEPRPRG